MLIACVVSGCAPTTPTGVSPESTIRDVFQTDLPSSVTNAQTWSARMMTQIVHGRFECDKTDLPNFLSGSDLIPDKLETGANPLRQIQAANLPWWQPSSLQEASGVECNWDAGSSVASCMLAAGREPGTERMVVYFMVVYESKNQTGLRPEVKADSQWGTTDKRNPQ